MPTATKTDFALNVLCKLNKVSIGDQTANLSLKIPRSDALTLDIADEYLCGRRLTGRVVTVREDEDARQTNFLEGERHAVAAVFDVKSFRVSPKQISCGLTFALKEIDVTELAQLANQTARLLVEEVGLLDGDSEDDEKEE